MPVSEHAGAWRVVSKKRAQQRGWSIPILIRNLHHHYTELVVFEDGVVDCWEGLDLPLFRKKLATGWMATTAPEGARLSIYNLGTGTVAKIAPFHALGAVEARAVEAIRSFNPELEGLIDLEGEATEPFGKAGKARKAKLPSLDGMHVRTNDAGERVPAEHVPVLVHEADGPRLTRWFVYADGRCRVGPAGELVDFDAVEEAVIRGEIGTSLVNGAWFLLDGIGRVKMSDCIGSVDPRERVREQRDHLQQLRGAAGAVAHCRTQWAAYEKAPSSEDLERLRDAYRAVPEHLRMYCGDMDSKDGPIRRALGLSSA